MNEPESGNRMNGTPAWVLPAVVAGAAVGIAIAITRKKKSRWDLTREMTERVMDSRDDLAEMGKDLVSRIQTIYHESRAVAEQVAGLWGHGRKVLRSAS